MPNAVKKEGSRERILDGAAEEFALAGFSGARIDRIARRTQLNVRMIYYHFGSKKGLYRAVLQSIYEEAVKIIEATRKDCDPTLAALGLYFDLLTDQPRFADVLVREVLDGGKHLKALFKDRPELFLKVHQHAHHIVSAGMEQGHLRQMDAAMVVTSLISIVCFMSAARGSMGVFLDGRVPDPAAFKSHLFQLLLDGIRQHPTAPS